MFPLDRTNRSITVVAGTDIQRLSLECPFSTVRENLQETIQQTISSICAVYNTVRLFYNEIPYEILLCSLLQKRRFKGSFAAFENKRSFL